jgi:hypothetical protein
LRTLGQTEITKFAAFLGITQSYVDVISELSSLEFLDLLHFGESVDLSALRNLKNLKEVRCTAGLETIQSKSLLMLSIEGNHNHALIEVAINCPNLSWLAFDTFSGDLNIEFLLLHFKRLERLTVKQNDIFFSDHNNHLEYLRRRHGFDDRMTATVRYKGLVSLSTDLDLKPDQLKKLLQSAPGLKSLCFWKLKMDHLDTIKNYGKNLDILHFTSSEAEWEKIKETLKNQFNEFNTKIGNWNFYQLFHCLAKKTGASVD